MTVFLENLIFGIGVGALDALLAMGIVLIFRTTGVLNFAQAAIGTLAAYVAYSISNGKALVWLWLAVPAALLVGGVLGALSYVAVRRVKSKQRALASAVATLAIAVLIRQVLQIQYGGTVGVFPQPFASISFSLGDVVIPGIYLAALLVAAAIALGIGLLLRYTSTGTMVRAIADQRDAASLCGANTALLVAGVWALAGTLAAVSGLFAAQIVFDPSFLDTFFVAALVAAVIGGLRSLWGAFVGAIALEIAKNMFINYAPSLGQYAQTFVLCLFVVLLVLAPRRWLIGAQGRTI